MVFLGFNRFVWALWPDSSQNPNEKSMEYSGCIPLCWSKGACIYAQHPLPSMYFQWECSYRYTDLCVLVYSYSAVRIKLATHVVSSQYAVCRMWWLVNNLYKSRLGPADVCIYANCVRVDELELSFSALWSDSNRFFFHSCLSLGNFVLPSVFIKTLLSLLHSCCFQWKKKIFMLIITCSEAHCSLMSTFFYCTSFFLQISLELQSVGFVFASHI